MITNERAAAFRSDFPLLTHNERLVYLDHAASSQKPKIVLSAMDSFYRSSYANVHRGLYKLSEDATTQFEFSRQKIAHFIGARSEEIIFTSGTTDGINKLALSILSLLPYGRRKILLTELEHHANIVPWQQFAKRHGFTIDFVRITNDFQLDMEDAKRKLDDSVALFAFSHVSNVLGTIQDVTKLCRMAKDKFIVTVVDGAQAVAHMPVDVYAIGCDFYVFSGHKLCGPTGIGVLYGRKQLLEKLPPFFYGGHMIQTVSKTDATWAGIPARFEAGTAPIVEAIGLAAAVGYLQTIGLDDIHSWEQQLSLYAREQLMTVKGLRFYCGPAHKCIGIISFTLDGVHAHDIASLLGNDSICVRAGHHCAMPLSTVIGVNSTARVSFHHETTTQMVDQLVDSLKKIVALFAGRQ
ncbi:MAG TPA: SufS family cysteine desulfurase [Acidobacteriota bacterium]|nr:SufS family cysteine desulfurase [Acidobacteriota bacterium]